MVEGDADAVEDAGTQHFEEEVSTVLFRGFERGEAAPGFSHGGVDQVATAMADGIGPRQRFAVDLSAVGEDSTWEEDLGNFGVTLDEGCRPNSVLRFTVAEPARPSACPAEFVYEGARGGCPEHRQGALQGDGDSDLELPAWEQFRHDEEVACRDGEETRQSLERVRQSLEGVHLSDEDSDDQKEPEANSGGGLPPEEDSKPFDLDMLAEVTKRRPWRKMKEKVQASVQVPPPGPFSRTDILWEEKINAGNGYRRQTQKATIPWNRLEDFLEGEMSGRQHPCTFVEESRKCIKKDDRKQIRADSAVQEIRYGVTFSV